MTYELAKQLKDAGFPQDKDGMRDLAWYGKESVYAPDLATLIEACGDKFYALVRDTENYYEGVTRKYKIIWQAKETGIYFDSETPKISDTPEEAVANLWLKLNQP